MKAKYITIILLLFLSACKAEDGVYTLYRNSPLDSAMRVHVATFDAKDGNDYNAENCQIGVEVFGGQPGVIARYWCEKGYYKE